MPKYLVQASYSAEGVKGLQKEKASGRVEAVKRAVEGLGGKVEAMYWAFGEHDVFSIFELPDNIKASALALAVAATGQVRISTTPLLSAAEVDQALEQAVTYRPPGS
jgi:uncharacterized protein with GYD domain